MRYVDVGGLISIIFNRNKLIIFSNDLYLFQKPIYKSLTDLIQHHNKFVCIDTIYNADEEPNQKCTIKLNNRYLLYSRILDTNQFKVIHIIYNDHTVYVDPNVHNIFPVPYKIVESQIFDL